MLVANKNSRFISLFLAVFLILTGITFLQLTSSAPAHADEASCASNGACQAISTAVALHATDVGGGFLSPGSSAPISSGGGGTASPPAVPTRCDTSPSSPSNWCAPDYVTRATFYAMSSSWSGTPLFCGVKTINGIKVHPVGYTLVEKKDFISFGNVAQPDGAYYTSWYTISTVCNYPPDPTITNTNAQCILSYNANISRLSNSYAGAAGISNKSQTISTLASLESNPSGCRSSITANFGVNIGHKQADYGQYKATSSVQWATCTFGSTTFNGTTTRSGGCRNGGTKAGSVGKLTVYCGPAIHAWVQLDWTGKDCYSTGPKCTVPNTSKFNTFTGNVQALRDGNDNTMAWANPVFTAGISGAGNWKTKTDVKPNSTPYKSGVGVNDKTNQMFRSNQSFGAWETRGGALAPLQNQKIAFYTSGSTGSPFGMTRNYLFDANFRTVSTTINGYNVTTGAISTGSSSTTVYLRNNPCGPQSSPSINAVRAIGDVITAG